MVVSCFGPLRFSSSLIGNRLVHPSRLRQQQLLFACELVHMHIISDVLIHWMVTSKSKFYIPVEVKEYLTLLKLEVDLPTEFGETNSRPFFVLLSLHEKFLVILD